MNNLLSHPHSNHLTSDTNFNSEFDCFKDPITETEVQILMMSKPYSMTPPMRIINTIRAVEHVVKNKIPGSFVECGVWKGGNTMAALQMMLLMGEHTREVYLYDTFEGMAKPTEVDVRINDGASAQSMLEAEIKTTESHMWCYSPLDQVKNDVNKVGYPQDLLTFIKGKVEDTIPKTMPTQISVLRLDTDWYESTIHELEYLYPLLSPGGILIIDDYGCWNGCRKAVDEYFAKLNIIPELIVVPDDWGDESRYCIKSFGSKVISPVENIKSNPTFENIATSPDLCPITGKAGVLLSERDPNELFNAYETYFGTALPKFLKEKYFNQIIFEYQSAESGLRWFSPSIVGESDFYEILGSIYPWYYRDEAWDKDILCQILKDSNINSFLDYGCGNGALLLQARRNGIEGWGVDINKKALAQASANGLPVFHNDELTINHPPAEVISILQTIEHVADPVKFTSEIVNKFNAQVLIMSAPCHETLLGSMKDPLSWPPHHISMWSEKAFESLAKSIGFKVTGTVMEPLSPARCEGMLKMEGNRTPRGLPTFPEGAALLPFLTQAAERNAKWAMYSHSIVAVLEKS
jgi:O-methyltransferase